MKKRVLYLLAAMLFFTVGSLQAEGMKCGTGKCGASVKNTVVKSLLLHDVLQKDGYTVVLESKKPLVAGNNMLLIRLIKQGVSVTDVKVKIKFFMPQMPGMPYMESKSKFTKEGDIYTSAINFSMNGTWQYQLKFKDAEHNVHTIRGSVTL